MATQVGSLQLASSRALSYAVTSPSSDGQHPFVLLASPLCTTLAVWDPVVPHLTALGFRVLRYDPPGHGSSGVPSDLSSTTFDSIAQDVRDLLTHLDVQKVHTWIGDSLGAATAITFAAKYPGLVERLVPCCTISSSPINTGAADTFGPRVAAAREAGNMDATIEETLGRWFGRDWLDSHPEEAERMRKLMHDTSIDGFETCCAALQSRTFDIRPLAADAGRHIEAALLLVGEKDAGLGPVMEELRQGIETGLRSKKGETVSVDLKTVRNGGHVPFIDGSESFWEHITPFLK
ncbi:Alpha/Beta hydrolase protein [Xylaria bambusicola]|uniref:Alpha/Beta hydrolase protein n=1 Tax=Xylaria bambusicola TaxID=326684 RepID=UPI0020088FC1|nr:Alpha/Beta hydrolase protein [Xylaria bambusicola]KAI0508914.1 Alpha/Beta hydrolase protein [Xylaria bambusicola]